MSVSTSVSKPDADTAIGSPPAAIAAPMAALLTAEGIAVAFGVAACCGLPFILANLGLSAAWLSGVALLAAPHRQLLVPLAALLLLAGAFALWRQHRAAVACRVDGVCARPAARLMTLAGLVTGTALFVTGYLYA